MGWSSGNEVFDPVARQILRFDLPPQVAVPILSTLITALQERDWDTEDESLAEFADVPAVVAAFAECGIRPAPACPHVDCPLCRDGRDAP